MIGVTFMQAVMPSRPQPAHPITSASQSTNTRTRGDSWRECGYSTDTGMAASVEVSAGLALMGGWQVRWLALAAAVFLMVDALLAHAFRSAVPQDQRNQLLHFFKNLALAGAFVMLAGAASSVQVSVPVLGAQ